MNNIIFENIEDFLHKFVKLKKVRELESGWAYGIPISGFRPIILKILVSRYLQESKSVTSSCTTIAGVDFAKVIEFKVFSVYKVYT